MKRYWVMLTEAAESPFDLDKASEHQAESAEDAAVAAMRDPNGCPIVVRGFAFERVPTGGTL